MPQSVVDLAGDGVHARRFRGSRLSLATRGRFAFALAASACHHGSDRVGVGVDSGGEARPGAGS
ncbi:MAG: hypothetical protein DI640_14470, partial [Sphingomonas taxi]